MAALTRLPAIEAISLTERPGHAGQLAAAAVNAGASAIVVAGGDGTVHEVINGVLGLGGWPSDLRLAVLPLGTSNAFCRHFGLKSGRWRQALDGLADGCSRRVDLGHVTAAGFSRYFATCMGTGFMALVAQAASRRFGFLGASRYTAAVVSQLPRLATSITELELDGPRGTLQRVENLALVAVCNTRWTGNQMKIAPGAEIDDGMLDVVSVGNLSRIDFLLTFLKVFSGGHLNHPGVSGFQVTRVSLPSVKSALLVLDGEIICCAGAGVQVEIAPNAAILAL